MLGPKRLSLQFLGWVSCMYDQGADLLELVLGLGGANAICSSSACVAAIIKIPQLVNYGKEGDLLWDSRNITIWTV